MIKLITDDEYGMGNWFNVLVVACVYVVMRNAGKSLPLGSVCDVAGCDSYELGRMVSRVVQHLEINLPEFDIVGLFRRVVNEMFNKFCIGKEKLARVMQQGVFLLQCMIKWYVLTGRRPVPAVVAVVVFVCQLNGVEMSFEDLASEMNVVVTTCKFRYKELLETLVEVARVCLPWGNDVSVKNIMKNAPFVIQYMEVKSTCERGNEVMSLEEVGARLDTLVNDCLNCGDDRLERSSDLEIKDLNKIKVSPECLSKIYLKFVQDYSNIKTLSKRVENNKMERSGKSKLFVDTTDYWKGNSELSKKLFLDKILEADVGFNAMPPSFVNGCLKTERIKGKIHAAKMRIEKIRRPPGVENGGSEGGDVCASNTVNSKKRKRKEKNFGTTDHWEDFVIETLLLHQVKEEEIEKGYYNTLLDLHVYVRPAGSYGMDRLELRRVTVYPGRNVSDILIVIGNFSIPTGLRVAKASLLKQQAEIIPEHRALVFPMVKHPFVVGFLVAELPKLETRKEKDDVKPGLLSEDSYAKLNAINISRSVAMAYVMDQKAMLLQQSSWQNNVRMNNLVEEIRGPLSSIRTLSKMLAVAMKKNEIPYDIVEDIMVLGDHMKDTLQQLQEAVQVTKTNIVCYNEENLVKIDESMHESVRTQLSNVLSKDTSISSGREYGGPFSLSSKSRDFGNAYATSDLAPLLSQDIRPCNASDVLSDLVDALEPLALKQTVWFWCGSFDQLVEETVDFVSLGMVEDNMTWNFVAGLTVAREILESYGCVLRVTSPRCMEAPLGAGGTPATDRFALVYTYNLRLKLVNMKSKTKAVKRKTPHDFEMDYETQCPAKKVNSRMPKSCCISLEPDVNSCRSEAPLKTIGSMHPPFGRKRKTPNDFAIDSGIPSVTKKGNFGVRENSCSSSQPNSNGDHSDVSLNINTMHETYGSTHIDVMRKGDPSMWNETQQLGSVMSRKKSSNDPCTVIANHFDCTDATTHFDCTDAYQKKLYLVTLLDSKEFAAFDLLGFWKAKELMFHDHLNAQEHKQHNSGLKNPIDVEEEILDDEVQQNEAIPLSEEEIALDVASSEGTMSGSGSGG
ncbi:plant-specific TFIIB-related protein PTF2 [Tanacetum coccineum]